MSEQTINLFDVGCLVNLRISRWSGRKMISEEDMRRLGIDTSNLPREVVNYGRKLLVDGSRIKRISKIEQRARTYLARWSVPFGIANCHFVPISILATVNAKLNDLQKEFDEEVDSFIKDFNEMKNSMQNTYPDFWQKCLKQHYPSTPELLRNKFSFKWYHFKVDSPNIKETNPEELIAKDKEARHQMQEEVRGFVAEYIASMRAEVVKFCELMTARVNGKPYGDEEESKKLTGKSLSSFAKFIDRFKQMNIFGDNEIAKMLNDFRDQFLTSVDSVDVFDNDQVQKGVTNTLTSIRAKAALIGDQESQFLDKLKRNIVI